jgi:GTPase
MLDNNNQFSKEATQTLSLSLNERAIKTRSGFIALVGRPNVGKSSLMNKLVGQKIAIVSPKVQTTRTKILGVYNYPNKSGQIVFIDLPGVHRPVDKLGETCLKISQDGASEADLIIFMSEANRTPGKGDEWISTWLKQNCTQIPHLILLNKVDLAKDKKRLSKDLESYEQLFAELNPKPKILAISTFTEEGLEDLIQEIWKYLPEGPFYFPTDAPTNRSIRFLASELIREQILHLTQEEVPHSVAVLIEDFSEQTEPKVLTKIRAQILVETESQKGILIGKRGSMIKDIGIRARSELEELIGTQVFLELKVKVSAKWRQDLKQLNRLGYSGDEN